VECHRRCLGRARGDSVFLGKFVYGAENAASDQFLEMLGKARDRYWVSNYQAKFHVSIKSVVGEVGATYDGCIVDDRAFDMTGSRPLAIGSNPERTREPSKSRRESTYGTPGQIFVGMSRRSPE
jgi:hypothetical protein